MTDALYTGHLKRGDGPNTVVGYIQDAWEWIVRLTGTRDVGGGYTLSGGFGDHTIYTGRLQRGDTPNTIVGFIKDSWGWIIHLTGTRDAGGGYTLSGVLGDPPASLRIDLIDGAPPVVHSNG